MGGGFQRICKLHGSLVINGERYVWDYVADEAVSETEMPHGSERRKASDKARAELLRSASAEGSR